ncbi:hypothetical protein LJR030_004966 [Rhizobium sp. LjRoot30]|uniref:hypothetical protein n=1 Tax=Rhizobium sp. LjRoot30 TaxID=3342320 RepID=UPI003ECDB9AD
MSLYRLCLILLRKGAIPAGSFDEIARARRLADAEIARLPLGLGLDLDWPPRAHPRIAAHRPLSFVNRNS